MLDKRLLVDSLSVSLVTGKDEWGKEQYASPFVLSPVRFDRSVKTSHYGKNEQRSHYGVIFVYPEHALVKVDESWLQAQIQDGETTYKVVGFQTNKYPFKDKVFSYEVEVV